MSETLDDLEERINALRREIRQAVRARESVLARSLRAELRSAERAWDQALAVHEPVYEPGDETGGEPGHGTAHGPGRESAHERGDRHEAPGSLVPVREQVHQALTLLGVPAAAKMIVAVHAALRAGSLKGAQLASLRRDEERSFRTSPFARPYYLCAALTDRLSASRGLLAVSTWPLEQRVVGPLSPRVDFLTTAIRVAEHIMRMVGAGEQAPPSAQRLLSRLAHNIPGAAPETGRYGRGAGLHLVDAGTARGGPEAGALVVDGFPGSDPATVVKAARAELEVHAAADTAARAEIAGRARDRLQDAERLFGGTVLGLARKEASR
ncbi:hypothetical protein [Sphaerisporangium perillae]|uniref:hypothetical protein n=1 Tax=Sphaerisporangium perillae TaxID=2935860 RepID=UPI002010206E|nr:hypothetical protein [Sphaerisporangium perillae]